MKKAMLALFALVLPFTASCTSADTQQPYGDYVVNIEGEEFAVSYRPAKGTETEPLDYDPDMVIDLFADIDEFLVYNGGDGKGGADIEIPEDYKRTVGEYTFKRSFYDFNLDIIYDNEMIAQLQYSIVSEKNHSMSQGDTFTVKICAPHDAAYISDFFKETGHIVLENERTFTYPAVGTYLKKAEEYQDAYTETAINYVTLLCEKEDKTVDSVHLLTIKAGEAADKKRGKCFLAVNTYHKTLGLTIYFLDDLMVSTDGGFCFEYSYKSHIGNSDPDELLEKWYGSSYDIHPLDMN